MQEETKTIFRRMNRGTLQYTAVVKMSTVGMPNTETFLASASSLAFFFFSLGPASFWAFLSASLAAAFAFLAALSAAFASYRITTIIIIITLSS